MGQATGKKSISTTTTSAPGDTHSSDDVDIVCQLESSTCSLDPIDYLPNEILWKIIGFLSVEDLCHLAVCSKAWRNVTNTNSLWLHLCKLRDWERFGTEVDLLKEKPIHSTETSTSGNSPTFQADSVITVDCNLKDLAPTCEWKEVYMRARHLDRNWSEGRYREHLHVLSELSDRKTSCVASDGRTFAAGDELGFVRLWDLNSGSFLRKIQPSKLNSSQRPMSDDCDRQIRRMALRDNVGVAVFMGGILVFEGSTGNVMKLIQGKESDFDRYYPYESHFEENKIIVTYRWNHNFLPIHIWDITDLVKGVDNAACTETILQTPENNLQGYASWDFLGCHGHYVITSQSEVKSTEFLLWDTKTPKLVRSYKGHRGSVLCGHLRENTIMTGDNVGEIKVWTTASEVCLNTLSTGPERQHFIRMLQFTDKVIVANANFGIVFWSRNGILLNRHGMGMTSTSKMHGNRLATHRFDTYEETPIRVWELSTGKLLHDHKGFELGPTKLVHTDDTKIVVHVCRSNLVKIIHYW